MRGPVCERVSGQPNVQLDASRIKKRKTRESATHLSELRQHRHGLAHRLQRLVVPPPQQRRDERADGVRLVDVDYPGEHTQAVVPRVAVPGGVEEVRDGGGFGEVAGWDGGDAVLGVGVSLVPFEDDGCAVAFACAKDEAVTLWVG